MRKIFTAFLSLTAIVILLLTGGTAHAEGDALTLRDAVLRALERNPRLAAFAWDIRAADARILQAGLRPNPELSLEIEDIRWTPGPRELSQTRALGGAAAFDTVTIPWAGGPLSIPYGYISPSANWERERGQGAHSGFAESEFTLSLAQVIELGGKRAKRVALAKHNKDVVQWDYEAARANVLAEVARAFTDVLVAQERVALQDELVRLAEDVDRSIRIRVNAGKVSPLESSRAEVALTTSRIARDNAARELTVARTRLAATWGDTSARFGIVAGQLDEVHPIPSVETLENTVRNNPDLARWTVELSAREAQVKLERARRIPSPTLELGFKTTGLKDRTVNQFGLSSSGEFGVSRSDARFDRGRDNSLVLGMSIALPLFDRNQGNIAEAEHMASKTAEERREAEVAVHYALVNACETAAGAFDELASLRKTLLPTATDTFEKTKRGYEQGKFGYLDVLDAQRTLVDARITHLDALGRYHAASVDIERLTGKALSKWAPTTEETP